MKITKVKKRSKSQNQEFLKVFTTFKSVLLGFAGIFIGLFSSSCSVNKYIPQGESLYTGAKIKIISDSTFDTKQTKVLKDRITTIVRPMPNKRILGFPHKVWFYYVIGEPKRKTGFRQWFRKKLGEPPVLASKRVVSTNTEIISNFLNNEGYFRSTATGELIVKGKIAEANYVATIKPRYTIGRVVFVKKDSAEFSKNLAKTQTESLLQSSDAYRFDNIKLERDRIDKALKLIGYYYFRPDFLIIKADTNQQSRKVDLFLELKPNVLQTALKQYRINDISVYVDTQDSTKYASQARQDLIIFDPKQSYRTRVFNDAISFQRGRYYNSQTHDASLSRLINLRNFKFVKNRFELVNRSDSALINVIYDLTSLKNKSLQAELNGLTRSNNLTGVQLGTNWLNRNVFKGAEILKIGINTGFDFQLGSKLNSNKNLNSYYSLAGDADLTFPRFVLPFYKVKVGQNQALPRTTINIGYTRLIQKGIDSSEVRGLFRYNQYTITSLRSSLSYNLRKNASVEQTFTPISINLIKPKNVSETFTDIIFRSTVEDLIRYINILKTRLILGGQYNIVYTPKQSAKSRHYFYVNAGVDFAGNLAGLLTKRQSNDPKKIGNTVFEQYTRFDLETRYYLDISPRVRWANRAILGYGLPYGNSKSLPNQVKQYFVGGSNSIRAFRARSLGPGEYKIDSAAIFTTSYGDVKVELNTELRIKASQIINLAAFVDAGNVWLTKFNEEAGYPKSSVFGKDFYKQLAIGGGVGLRLDFTFVKLRLDLATPFRKPWLPENERWVFNDFRPSNKSWRKENLILNIAVDYPF